MADWRSPQFKRACSANLGIEQMKRVNKLYIDEFYLMRAHETVNQGRFVYCVSGSTGTEYTIVLEEDGTLRCDCPDFKTHCQKHDVVCKHIVFLLFRVLKETSLLFFSDNKFDETAIARVLQSSRPLICRATELKAEMQKDYAKASLGPDFSVNRQVDPDDDCPICFDSLNRARCCQCPDCQNVLHIACVVKWLSTSHHKSCVYCRSSVWSRFW